MDFSLLFHFSWNDAALKQAQKAIIRDIKPTERYVRSEVWLTRFLGIIIYSCKTNETSLTISYRRLKVQPRCTRRLFEIKR